MYVYSLLFVDIVISNVISDRLQFLSSPACSLFHVFSAVGSTSQTSSSGDVTVLSDERPTLPELMELNIPQLVGTNYENFGTLLLNDDTGGKHRCRVPWELRENQYKDFAGMAKG